MKNPSETAGAAGTATVERRETQPIETQQPELTLQRLPIPGLSVLFRPQVAPLHTIFVATIHSTVENTGLERRVGLEYIDSTGQHIFRANVPYGDQPGCWQYNEVLEQQQARITASYLMRWGAVPGGETAAHSNAG